MKERLRYRSWTIGAKTLASHALLALFAIVFACVVAYALSFRYVQDQAMEELVQQAEYIASCDVTDGTELSIPDEKTIEQYQSLTSSMVLYVDRDYLATHIGASNEPAPGGPDQGFGNGQRIVDVPAHRRARPRARHLGDGTAHIAVEPDEPLVPELPGRLLHERRFAAEELDDDGPVLRAGGEQFRRTGALVDKPLGADHLSAADRRAEPAAQQAERQVRPSGQRREPRLVGSERQKNVVRQGGHHRPPVRRAEVLRPGGPARLAYNLYIIVRTGY